MNPTITRLPDDGPWRRYSVCGDDPQRHVTCLVVIRDGRHCIDHTICCLTSLHAWPEYFEGWQGYRDIPNGFELTEAGRGLFAEADKAARREERQGEAWGDLGNELLRMGEEEPGW